MRALAAGVLAVALTASIAACGSESSSDSNEKAGTYQVKVVTAKFPTAQHLGQTSLMRLGVRNTGRKTVPALAVTISIAGKKGRTSSLPFTIHDPQPGLAQPDRPVWVLASHYPKFAGSSKPGGTGTSNPKTFNLGPLKPGATTEAIWKLSAVKEGEFTLLYGIDAGLSEETEAETAAGVRPGGSFAARISSVPPNVTVTDSGEVVTLPAKPKANAK